MSYATLEALRESLAKPTPVQKGPVLTPEYKAKMMHDIPKTTVVDRAEFILEHVRGKRVLELGASCPMHAKIVKAAAKTCGIDLNYSENVLEFDLDDVQTTLLPWNGEVIDIIVCGEVIEHLSNPGWLLKRLREQRVGVPVIITVPNAFSEIVCVHLENSVENVNIDHVSWYSYRTLRTLIERAGYTIKNFHWYGGQPYVSEGLVMLVE